MSYEHVKSGVLLDTDIDLQVTSKEGLHIDFKTRGCLSVWGSCLYAYLLPSFVSAGQRGLSRDNGQSIDRDA